MPALTRGLAAGAVGTTVLNAVTYLDMALTGRPSSSVPIDTALRAADLVGLELPQKRFGTGPREEAYGALAGLATGIGIGGVAGLVRGAGIRLPLLAEAAVIGFGAMAATDGPAAVLEATDITTWSSKDWLRDVVPHLAYGAAVAATLRSTEPEDESERDLPRRPARPGTVLLKSLAIGLATGARSSLGLVPPALAIGPRSALVSAGLVGTELVFDKLPQTPSRLDGQGAIPRVVAASVGAAVVARNEGVGVAPAAAAGAVGAVVGSVVGAIWRNYSADRGWRWQGAAVEDAVGLALTAYAWKA